jgi:hypothetical protein
MFTPIVLQNIYRGHFILSFFLKFYNSVYNKKQERLKNIKGVVFIPNVAAYLMVLKF